MRMNARGLPCALLVSIAVSSASLASDPLPFDRENINRYSVDGIPRSLSIRQGADVWLAYDLERATVFKVWQAPTGRPGLIATEFTVKSSGTAWFNDPSSASWELLRHGRPVPLTVRYLGCTQREDGFELSWEMRHDSGALVVRERVAHAAAAAPERVRRELSVESLAPGEVLRLPAPARDAWNVGAGVGAVWQAITLR